MCISDLSPCELVTLSSSLAIAINNQLCHKDAAILAGFFTTLGDNLALIDISCSNL